MSELDLLDRVDGDERESAPDYITAFSSYQASTTPSTEAEFKERYHRLRKLGASEKQATEGAKDALAFLMHRLFFLGKL